MHPKIMPHHLPHTINKPVSKPAQPKTTSFSEILSQTSNSLKVSKHAEKRLQERGIHVPDATWQEMGTRVKEAKAKGITDSLVLTKDAAFVVSAKNETVITAMDREEASHQLFTNINGAIIL
ncbi:flagellar protein [Paenalkalicoccus suaedae]|uniref:Flagellar protein n=1 Tax=Paenalkalicoccus suaedae TaxID=2592382 RepID=A0A859FDJ5_9BACI|nr:TIGR02530 family flagellar biosynthesis protein [Paenalkalicoccus suaedae]QKS71433.1 flagellar protein [Paenalkalicoccus suaedae]